MAFVAWALINACTSTRCSLRGSVAMNHTMASKCNDMGIGLLQANQFQNAAVMFRAAINYKDDYVSAHTNLAFAHILMEEFDESLPVLETAVLLDPTNFLVHFYFGVAYASNGRLEKAVDSLERTIELNPSFKPAILRAGLAYLLLNETDKAQDLIMNVSDPHVQAGLYYLKSNKTDQAIWSLHEAVRAG